ncbi:hypothetical protein RRG08_056990 [Elysia crispata]|uniref:PiggyBac transposable element-derived protein domain-containing protein n=1 Tax=Elysia crispata TaxID=231223 RepID=A0AAE0Z787_9GAST|nr:hypothetical protein RRG08_056990 [Elysia crispata]
MGGGDLADKKAYHLAVEGFTRRYWKKIFHDLLDIALVNGHILFMKLKNPRMDRRRFAIELVEGLCSGQPRQPAVLGLAGAACATHRLVLLEGKKEYKCYVCSTHQRRRRSRHWCPACKVGGHEKCEVQLVHRDDIGLQKKHRAMDLPDEN